MRYEDHKIFNTKHYPPPSGYTGLPAETHWLGFYGLIPGFFEPCFQDGIACRSVVQTQLRSTEAKKLIVFNVL